MAQQVADLEKKIILKALVDKGRNRVIFVEADNDFIDILFSFLTIPMGQMVRLARNHSKPLEIGCMSKLYQSIEKLDEPVFRSNACKDMLLLPYSAAFPYCKSLKLKFIDDAEPRQFECYYCSPPWYSSLASVHCPDCKVIIDDLASLLESDSQVGGVFVKEQTRVIISDDLQVMPPSRAAIICLFSKLGVMNSNTTEERTFSIGVEQVLNLLVCSFVSKMPFTETLLKPIKPVPELGGVTGVNFSQGNWIDSVMSGVSINEEEEICVKLIVSKSRNVVCYAEVQEDFVNLIFNFLTLPLGFILKQMMDCSWQGCIDQLCKSVLDLDEQYIKSKHHKELLCNPKSLPGFSHENNILGIEETVYYIISTFRLTADRSIVQSKNLNERVAKFVDPKSHGDKISGARGFLKEPATFIITDNLDVRPASALFQLSVLNDSKVHFADTEDQTVHVGKKEALRLLVASFVSDSVLTNVFLRNPIVPSIKQEQ